MIDKKNNLRIWREVETTNPDHTKKVEFGRKFTAIDAQYQIQTATEVFGPVGQGWGYDCVYSTITLPTEGDLHATVLAVVDVTLWWNEADKWEGVPTPGKRCAFGPVRGSDILRDWDQKNKKERVDTDAFKKATTDALTKGLSHLGFNADVFLGKFDDNKYVQQRTTEVRKQEEQKAMDYQANRNAFIKAVSEAKTPDEVRAILDKAEWINELSAPVILEITTWTKKRIKELLDTQPPEPDKE